MGKQNPSGTGIPAAISSPRLAAFAPTSATSPARRSRSMTTSCIGRDPVHPGLVVLAEPQHALVACEVDSVPVAGLDRVEDRQILVGRELDLGPVRQVCLEVPPEP